MTAPEIKDILFTADGITDKPMPTSDDIEALQEENERLRARVDELWAERCQLVATEAVCDELHELLDLYMIDGTIHGLDRCKPEDMQSTLASVLCELMQRLKKAEAAIHGTINENSHLADGDDCTLRKLVAHVREFPGQA
jgi:hypothetical protein